ncbi:MAG TPA: type I secretion system permease/ATPase [Allosphingosinicella sp.]|uniref:type I secretion system permease/ATPase n=1 Tax=Allosphingosinicella sp. TaxID=2823234 RepID=UPI002ED890D5
MYLGKKSPAADGVAGTAAGEDAQAASSAGIDPVLECLAFLARQYDRPSSSVILRAGLALDMRGWLPFHQAESALEQIGMRGIPRSISLRKLRRAQLPALLQLDDDQAAVLLEVRDRDFLLFLPGASEPIWVPAERVTPLYSGAAILVEADPARERERERPWQKAARTHWFWSEFRKVRRSFLHVALAAAIVNLLALALPLFTMNVYDRIIPNKTVSSLWVLAAGVLLALALEFTLRLARARVVDDVGGELDARLSQKLFEKVMNMPLLSKEGSTGALARRVSDYEAVRDFFASTTVVLVVDMLFLFVFLAVIAIVAGWLVMVPVTGIVVMLVLGIALQKAMSQVSLDAQTDSSLQHGILVESISGQETLKAARAEGRMLGRWRRYAEMSASTQKKLRGLSAIAINLASLCQQMISVGLIIGGFYLFNAGTISMGAIIAVVMLAGRALSPIGQFAFLMTRAKQAILTMRSLQTLAEAPDERAMAARSVLPAISRGDIEFQHVDFTYPGASRASLSDISLAIRPGERIGVIGRVASGKSTFGRLLCGLYPPSEGVLLIDDLDSRQHHPHQIRTAFRYVGQDAELFSGTVRDNLLLGSADADEERLIDAVKRSGADIFLSRDAAGFDLLVGEKGSRLSGGQRSFLVLARALVEPCKLLFLDEPTGAMDTQSERWFIDHLKTGLAADQTLVVSTHRNAMLDIVDRLIVIDQGRIIADGLKDDVMRALTNAPAGDRK